MADRGTKVKVGLIGVNHPHARAHLRTLQLLDEVESVVAWDEGERVLALLKQDMGQKLETTVTALDKFLARPDVPIVVILAPNNRNPDLVIRAAGAEKHVISEKPGAANSADMSRILNVVRHAGVRLSFYYQWRFHPISRDIRNLIAQGALGRLMSIEARMVTSQVRFRDPSHWLFKKGTAGGGILSWLGCHWIDLLRFLVQDEVEAVSAFVGTLNGEAIDVEDTATVSMRFTNGALATLHAGYLLPRSVSGYTGATYDTYLAIRGLDGYVTWSPMEEPVLRAESVTPGWVDAPRREFKYSLSSSEAYGGTYGMAFVRQFIRSALYKETPPNTGDDALRVLRIIEAAYQSSATGQTVKVVQ
ncbi:MAG: Gfo/Idh/MocA family oxidoreductase [Candidatus Latescibacteria bacterium]|nr:Gfo/Idh/MocA family oxidoreductase [Candidatus Latescibacterota bacterium]